MGDDGSNAGGAPRIGRRAVLAGVACGAAFIAVPAAARPLAERHLRLLCPETGERFAGAYWRRGHFVPGAMPRIDWLMRDFHCDAVGRMDPALIDLLHRIFVAAGGQRPVQVLSGFRTRATNLVLRQEGFPAAPHSQHLEARAADIRIEGVRVSHLHRLAMRLRRGGVGLYREYVHVDTGPLREWRCD